MSRSVSFGLTTWLWTSPITVCTGGLPGSGVGMRYARIGFFANISSV